MYSLLDISAFLALGVLFTAGVQAEVPPCSVVTEYATTTFTVDGEVTVPSQDTAATLGTSSAPVLASSACSLVGGSVVATLDSTGALSQPTVTVNSNSQQSESPTVSSSSTSTVPPLPPSSTSTSTPNNNNPDNANLTHINLRDPNDPSLPFAGVERINRCGQPLHYYPVWHHHISSLSSPSRPLPPQTLHFEPYHLSDTPHSPGSVSEKYSSTPFTHLTGDTPIVQVEYTVSRAQPDRISADLSTIDCGEAGERGKLGPCPVREGGYLLKFGKKGCRAARCVGETDSGKGCEGAYNVPSDDVRAMRTCLVEEGESAWVERWNLTVVFCPNAGDLEGVVL